MTKRHGAEWSRHRFEMMRWLEIDATPRWEAVDYALPPRWEAESEAEEKSDRLEARRLIAELERALAEAERALRHWRRPHVALDGGRIAEAEAGALARTLGKKGRQP